MNKESEYTRIIAGVMTWGVWGRNLDTTSMVQRISHCIAHGITTFDHADIYGDYSTEKAFGKAFKESRISRESVQLISKCGIQMTRGRDNKVKHYQYDKKYIIDSARLSIENLQVEYLDLLLLHRPSPLLHPEEVAEAFEFLNKEGLVRKFGVSNFSPSQASLLERVFPIVVNQVQFSLTHLDPMYDGTFDQCLHNSYKPMAWSPLGDYFKNKSKENDRIKKQLIPLMEKYEATEMQLLLAFILKHPARISPVIGTTDTQRMTESTAAQKIDLELEDWFLMLEAAQGHRVP